MAKTNINRGTLQQHPQRLKSLKLIEQSGEALRPPFYEYQGSAVVHYYALRGNEFAFIAHSTDLKKVPEQQASAGMTELARALMTRYGRTEPATRDPNKKSTDEGEVSLNG